MQTLRNVNHELADHRSDCSIVHIMKVMNGIIAHIISLLDQCLPRLWRWHELQIWSEDRPWQGNSSRQPDAMGSFLQPRTHEIIIRTITTILSHISDQHLITEIIIGTVAQRIHHNGEYMVLPRLWHSHQLQIWSIAPRPPGDTSRRPDAMASLRTT